MPKLFLDNWLGGKAGSKYIGQPNSYYDAEGLSLIREAGFLIPGWKLNAVTNSSLNAELDRIVSFAVDSRYVIAYGLGDTGKIARIADIETTPSMTADATWSYTISPGSSHTNPVGKDAIISQAGGTRRLYFTFEDGTDAHLAHFPVASASPTPATNEVLTFADKTAPHNIFYWKGTDKLYLTDGRDIASYDGTTAVAQALSNRLPPGWQAISFFDAGFYIGICAWFVGSETSANKCAVFYWNGVSVSFSNMLLIEDNKIFASITKNGIPHIFTGNRGFSGYLRGLTEAGDELLLEFKDDADTNFNPPDSPNQIDIYGGFVVWCNAGRIHTYGSPKRNISPYWEMPAAAITQNEEGAIKAVGGNILLYSYASGSEVNYLAYLNAGQQQTAGATLRTLWYSFPQRIKINYIKINLTGDLVSGEDFDVNFESVDKKVNGLTEIGTFNFTTDGAIASKTFKLPAAKLFCHMFRLELDWNASTTTALKSIVVDYDYVPDLQI